MGRSRRTFDKALLFWTVILIVFGFLIFNSASLGLLARGGAEYSDVAFSQTFYGLFLGTIAMIVTTRINFKFWRKHAFYIFLIAIVLTLLVFVPGIGFEHGGAKRWLNLGPASFQPSELLKVTFIIYIAAWLSGMKDKVKDFKSGFLPLLVVLGICGAILLAQPDTDTYAVMVVSGVAVYLAAGGRWRHVFLLGIIGILGLGLIALERPYVRQRIVTYFHPSADSQSAGYQIQQSLIAIGSGKITGRGFGQSVQKFNFLPEPIGDSIFAVAAEEFGFAGSVTLLFMFVAFSVRGLKIASRTDDIFGRLLVVGIVILIISQTFINMGAMLGVLPLTGIPLPFVSHGGTALFITLAEVGIILNVSKEARRTQLVKSKSES